MTHTDHATAVVVGAACWSGRWVNGPGQLEEPVEPFEMPSADDRVARADGLTRLGAAVVLRATEELGAPPAERLATIGGSVFASLHTNERYERRRLRTGRAPPRDFPFTAPNAWLGEVAACMQARGPCLCLVGGSDVGLVGIATGIRMLSERTCDCVVVVVAESLPDDRSLLPTDCRAWRDGAAAVVLERTSARALATLRAGWGEPRQVSRRPSYEVLAQVMFAVGGEEPTRVTAPAGAGAWCWVDVEPVAARR